MLVVGVVSADLGAAWAAEQGGLGILSGQNSASLGNTLAPRAVAKRCEVAVTVMNFDKLNLF